MNLYWQFLLRIYTRWNKVCFNLCYYRVFSFASAIGSDYFRVTLRLTVYYYRLSIVMIFWLFSIVYVCVCLHIGVGIRRWRTIQCSVSISWITNKRVPTFKRKCNVSLLKCHGLILFLVSWTILTFNPMQMCKWV